MKYIFCLFLSLIATGFCKADVNEDFVGLLLSDIKAEQNTNNTSEEDYSCITIGPSMMEKVLDMMSNDTEEDPAADTDTDKEHIKKILPHIKSLRIFNAQHNMDVYYNNALTLLNKNKNKYKVYNANGNETPCIWLRKNKDKVIEIIQINKQEDDLKVLNFTGDMTNDFVKELLKM